MQARNAATKALSVLTAIEKINKDTTLQDQLLKLLQRRIQWEDEDFVPSLNSSHHLIPFKCGTVYDVKTKLARPAVPKDFVSMTFSVAWVDVPEETSAEF